ncbi:ABC transporter ATP-binding protein [Rhodococcus erythropolis]|uniref:ABC transporter ATP-binding protein n=1 Tax=Rhodococcus erythropolis TaxID=1833 RepID=UPI001BEA87B6|nr:ABC transporter ATP-binding protein [Rhodococcus erythropolis]MBT2268977.1 ABC transporter ATP-binding protein [Rhodococcus erythropolis]
MARQTPVLEIENLCLSYGSIHAVTHVDFQVREGARHALIGPNGAGKSSVFQLIAGGRRASSGLVRYYGTDITKVGITRRSRLGIAQTFQHSSLFPSMTAAENVSLAAQRVLGLTAKLWSTPSARRAVAEAADAALVQTGLADRRNTLANQLSHGERQQLEVAIALASSPRLILFDEPTAGMSAAETERFVAIVDGLDPRISVLIIEHDLDLVFGMATEVTVLHLGRVIVTDTPDRVRAHPEVQEAYLGPTAHAVGASTDRSDL